jgi:hypothetical protein
VTSEPQHVAAVDAWLEWAAGRAASSSALLALFADAFRALWARVHPTLGDVTLTAIVERVLHNAGEACPLLAPLRVDPTGAIRADDIALDGGDAERGDLRDGVRFVLVELLTVLGSLTAEILTPDLHRELANQTRGAEDKNS